MRVIAEAGRKPIKAWIEGVELEDSARQQLLNVAALPFIYRHVAVMPDVHWGMGATVGSVIPTVGAIIPAAAGVDLGCGMIAQRTRLNASDLPDHLSHVRGAIERAIPCGRSDDGGANDKGSWRGMPPNEVASAWEVMAPGFRAITEKHPKAQTRRPAWLDHLGTLGTGNHFIEVCLDETQRVWVMLHSGSRGIGNAIGRYFIEKAKDEMTRWFIALPDMDLAYLSEGSAYFHDYVEAVAWAQDYALMNRRLMLEAALKAVAAALDRPEIDLLGEVAVACHHNYIARENHFGQNIWVTRKGAVRAREGDLGIIPGSMGARSYIVRGKGNAEAFMSCSHGAGRRMSRGEAKRRFTVADHEHATAGVECRKDIAVIDETPGAYKDIDAVLRAEADLVEIIHTLKQVVCVKG